MNFGELVTRAQERSYDLLKTQIDKRKAEGHKVYPEAAMLDKNGMPVFAPDGLKLPLRVDLAFQDSTGKVETESIDSFSVNFREPVFAQWENQLKIEIRSMCWDYLSFDFQPVRPSEDWEGLRQWFLRWFDVEDQKEADSNGLSGVVHFISDPEITAEGAKLHIDFGSANSTALGEFFDELIKLGAVHCVIGVTAEPRTFEVPAENPA